MADRAKHAFGALERVDENIASGVIDAFDVLFVKDTEGKPYIGWVDKQGHKVIVNENLDADLDALEVEMAKKANSTDVANEINSAMVDILNETTSYTDQKVKAAISEVSGAIEIVEF